MVDNIAAKYEHRAQSAAAIRNILAVVDAQQLLGEEEEAALAAFLEVRLCALVNVADCMNATLTVCHAGKVSGRLQSVVSSETE